MDNHTTFSSLATLRNIMNSLEQQMKEKHRKMTELRNDFLSLQRQLRDIRSVIDNLEKNDQRFV